MPTSPPPDGPANGPPDKRHPPGKRRCDDAKPKRWREDSDLPTSPTDAQSRSPVRASPPPEPKARGKATKPPKKPTRRGGPPKSGRVGVKPDGQNASVSERGWLVVGRRELRRNFPSWSISLIIHLALIVVLTLLFIRTTSPVRLELRGADRDDVGQVEELLILSDATPAIPTPSEGLNSEIPDWIAGAPSPIESSDTAPSTSTAIRPTTFLPGLPADRPSGLPSGGGLEGRTPEQRLEIGRQRGATDASEDAVELGLAWLASHQRRNGSWWFDHHDGPCEGRCNHPGNSGCSTAATGLALLAYLGAGYTAETGPYQEEVRNGIYYLLGKTRITRFGGDLREGSMYGHGIATLALCEAYAMTGDQAIRPIAQKAIDYICNAQHKAGGWRYTPRQPGDTTVFGWQYMALKSASMAGLDVPTPITHLAQYYLNTVQTGEGAYYGYLSPGKEPSPTAIGLLSRMYSGWRRTRPQLAEGVDYLFELAPSKTDMYFNYYATQVMSHYSGQHWDPWNRTMREYLIETQDQVGHARGSWYFPDEHGDQGGRLYNTAMAIMILEVYYRYMPLYESDAVDFSF